MKLLAFAATNSRVSINRALVEFAMDRLKAQHASDVEVEILDLNDFEMPIYSVDRQNETGIPNEAQVFFDKIGAADAVLVSFAEYNGSVTSAWKNIFDWMSRIDMKVWQGKPTVMLAATPGPRAGAGVLGGQEAMAPFFGMDLRGNLGIGTWQEAWDADSKALTRAEDVAALDEVLAALVKAPATEVEAA